jgi:heptose-I-phosphate ethanolaminephosphotransferase
MEQQTRALIRWPWTTHIVVVFLSLASLGLLFDIELWTLGFYLGIAALPVSGFTLACRKARPKKLLWVAKSGYIGSLTGIVALATLHSDNVNSYGPLLAATVGAILQTDSSEAISYLLNHVSLTAFLYATLTSTLIAITTFVLPPTLGSTRILSWHIMILLLGGVILSALGSEDARLIYQETVGYSRTLSAFGESRAGILKRSGLQDITTDFEGDLVVIMGESTSRHHLGLYGYVRNTTPRLESRRDELFIYEDVIATHSHTVQSFSDSFTLADRQTYQPLNELVDLITLLNTAGFHTTWLSNQNAVGVWDNPVAAIARQADVVKYHDPASGMTRARSVFDEAMLETLAQETDAVRHDKRFTLLHLMATHWPYCSMVPNAFAEHYSGYDGVTVNHALLGRAFSRLKKQRSPAGTAAFQDNIDCYDRAVRYADYVVDGAIEHFSRSKRPVFLVYLSDHGEAPLLGTAHDSRMHSHFHVEVPFIVWVNDAFAERYPKKMRAMAANQRSRMSLVDFTHSILDVAGVTPIPGGKDRSMFSATFAPFPRTTLHRQLGYDTYDSSADASERVRGNMNALRARRGESDHAKLWAHRVNSLGAMLEARDLFAGVELDVVFNSQRKEFFVHHPPVPNIGLSLALYLRQDNGRTKYWIDWKNAEPQNLTAALDQLRDLDQKHNLKTRTILETTETFAGLGQLADDGWHVSYYLPTDKLLACQRQCSSREVNQLVQEIDTNVTEGKFAGISFDGRLLPLYRAHLRAYAQERGLGVYTWDQNINMSAKGSLEQLKPYLDDPTISVVLVNFPSPFDI